MPKLLSAFRAVALLLALKAVAASAEVTRPTEVFPAANWAVVTPADAGMHEALLEEAREYALQGGGSGVVVRGGKLVFSWGDPDELYDLKSTTKSVGVTALGLALQDGLVRLDDAAQLHLPDIGVPPNVNSGTGWLQDITIRQLATHSAGFDKKGGYAELLFEPGTTWAYSDAGANWLADLLTIRLGADLRALMFARVFEPLGITPADLSWRDHRYREDLIDGIKRREFGSGMHANVDAMARLGYLYLRGGVWAGERIFPEDFAALVRRPDPDIAGLPVHQAEDHPDASGHYGLLWWNNSDGTLENVPTDAYWSWGMGESFIIVIPSLDMVVARAGKTWGGKFGDYAVLESFLEPIVESAYGASARGAPYPQSTLITGVDWAPASSIVSAAPDSDNWPLTWADDGDLYTAYGDGWGFGPQPPEKLSLGYARISGAPPEFTGVNIPSPTGEQKGARHRGKKASGMLMVDSVLYQWVRNANEEGEQCQLAASEDHAVTWEWSEWQFAEFGYCAFVNFGQNYAGARDGFVYMHASNTPSAYDATDYLMLTRVPKDRILDRSAYEFFSDVTVEGIPVWSSDIHARLPVFVFADGVNRFDITYNAPLGRYLLTMRSGALEEDSGVDHFSIFEGREPWGPWATVYFTEDWEGEASPGGIADWGESQHIPSKWISEDGRKAYLVFSGGDSFSVRGVTLLVAPGSQSAVVSEWAAR